MSILFMGGEVGAFAPSDSTARENDNATNYNGAFARAALSFNAFSTSSYFESWAWSATAETYIHFDLKPYTYQGPRPCIVALDGSTEVVRLNTKRVDSNTEEITLEAWDGLAWQLVGAAINLPNTVQTCDLFIDSSGTVTLFVGGTSRITETGMTVTAPDRIRLYATYYPSSLSQVVVADEPTIGWRLVSVSPAGAGATGDWTGTYTSVDEAEYDDADFIYSASAGQVELYTGTGPSLDGYTVRAVAVNARAKRGASGPANLQLALRVNGSDYFSSSKALSIGYGAYGAIWEDNPDTAVDWLAAQIPNIQFGVKSIT